MTWKKDPSQWPCYRITLANNQQRSVLCERCRLKRRDAKKQTTLKPSELSSTCPPQQQRTMKIQTRAFKCRQAILKRHERYRSKWGGEDPRR